MKYFGVEIAGQKVSLIHIKNSMQDTTHQCYDKFAPPAMTLFSSVARRAVNHCTSDSLYINLGSSFYTYISLDNTFLDAV